jgi:hypothetical protein
VRISYGFEEALNSLSAKERFMRFRRSAAAAAAGAALAGAGLGLAPDASAATPICVRSTCDLSGAPNTSQIYFEMPRLTPVTMLCWTDTQYYLGTVRWFKISTMYGTGFTSASEIWPQITVRHC